MAKNRRGARSRTDGQRYKTHNTHTDYSHVDCSQLRMSNSQHEMTLSDYKTN